MANLQEELIIAIEAKTAAEGNNPSPATIELLTNEYKRVRSLYNSASSEQKASILKEMKDAREALQAAQINKKKYEEADAEVNRIRQLIKETTTTASLKRKAAAAPASLAPSKSAALAAAESSRASSKSAASAAAESSRASSKSAASAAASSKSAASAASTESRDMQIARLIYEEEARRRESQAEEMGKRLRKTQLIENIIRNFSTISRLINSVSDNESDYNTGKDNLILAKEQLDNVSRYIIELDSIDTQFPILNAEEVRDKYIALQEELVSKQKKLIKNILNKIKTDSERLQRQSRIIPTDRITELETLFNIANKLYLLPIFTEEEKDILFSSMRETYLIINSLKP
jgi:hypothetical protein